MKYKDGFTPVECLQLIVYSNVFEYSTLGRMAMIALAALYNTASRCPYSFVFISVFVQF